MNIEYTPLLIGKHLHRILDELSLEHDYRPVGTYMAVFRLPSILPKTNMGFTVLNGSLQFLAFFPRSADPSDRQQLTELCFYFNYLNESSHCGAFSVDLSSGEIRWNSKFPCKAYLPRKEEIMFLIQNARDLFLEHAFEIDQLLDKTATAKELIIAMDPFKEPYLLPDEYEPDEAAEPEPESVSMLWKSLEPDDPDSEDSEEEPEPLFP